jgi:O-antigen/teichoic acid export membrane protein
MFRPEREVGYYSVSVKVASLTIFALEAINTMAAPKFSELFHTGKMDELFHVARKSTRLIFWTTTPILLVLLVLGKPILGFIFGDEFTAAYLSMVFLVLGQFVNAVSGSTGHFMNMTGHQNALKNVILVTAISNVLLSLILIPYFGIEGAAFSAMVSQIFLNVYALMYIKKSYGKTIGYLPLLRWRVR